VGHNMSLSRIGWARATHSKRIIAPEVCRQAAIYLACFALVATSQFLSRAYSLPFGGYPDEPGHYLTGVMLHDYALSGFSQNPLQFAERFYVHYPAISFGMWGPSFHVLEAIWMLAFSESRLSILLLVGAIAAGFMWCTQWMIGRIFGRAPGMLAGFLVWLIPAFQIYSSAVMADLLTGTFIFFSVYLWSRYLESGRHSMALGFGLFATIALLTKANAGCLALFPIPAAVLAGRTDLLRERVFWMPAAMAALFAGPWYAYYSWLVWNIAPIYVTPQIAYSYASRTIALLGAATTPFVLAGMASGFFKTAPRTAPRALWAAAVSLTLSFIVYHCITPGGFEPRYVLMTAPWIVLLFALGVQWAATAFLPSRRAAIAVGLIAATVIYGAVNFRVYRKPRLPYAEAARDLIPVRTAPQTIFIVSSETTPETVMVAEIAMRDRRPNHFVLRSSKILASMNWGGDRYENKMRNDAQIGETLRSLGVGAVIIDATPSVTPWPHHVASRRFVSSDPEWSLTHKYQEVDGGPVVEVYAFKGVVKMPRKIDVDVRYTLRRVLSAPVGAAP